MIKAFNIWSRAKLFQTWHKFVQKLVDLPAVQMRSGKALWRSCRKSLVAMSGIPLAVTKMQLAVTWKPSSTRRWKTASFSTMIIYLQKDNESCPRGCMRGSQVLKKLLPLILRFSGCQAWNMLSLQHHWQHLCCILVFAWVHRHLNDLWRTSLRPFQ